MGAKLRDYDYNRSTKKVGQLIPILRASDGEVIDGVHRLEEVPSWESVKLHHIKTKVEKLAARVVANMCRRDIPKKEKDEWVTNLAKELQRQGVKKGQIAKEISELTGMSERWALTYLPKKFKEEEKVKAGKATAARHAAERAITSELKDTFSDVLEQVEETVAEAPDKTDRVVEIVKEELRSIPKRLAGFPKKSRKMGKKFAKLREWEERGIIPYTVWDFRYRDDYAGDKDFHGNCSPQLVEQCVWRFTKEGDLVVDPMAGSGTVLDVCRRYNRHCVGYDIKPTRKEIIRNDSRKIPLEDNSVDMVFIHPPYWNLIHFTKARENLSDLSRAKRLEDYLAMLKEVFKECYRILKLRRYMCILIGDLIRDGKFTPLCRRVTNLAEGVGFMECGHAVKLAHGEMSRKKSGVIVAELAYTNNLKISHDLVSFFRK